MKLILSIITALSFFYGFSQNDKAVIEVNYNAGAYRKIALDTIKYMFEAQKKSKPERDGDYYYFVQDSTKLNDLSIKIIPEFRLNIRAFTDYNNDKNIEDYILFEERYKYLEAIVSDKNDWKANIEIPDLNYETERFYPGEWVYADDESEPYYYIKKLRFWTPDLDYDYSKEIYKFPNRFYFKIWGLPQLLLYVDEKDNRVYGRYIGQCPCMRWEKTIEEFKGQTEEMAKIYPLNELVLKYAGVNRVKQVALGFCNPEYGAPDLKLPETKPTVSFPKGRILKVIKSKE